MSQTVGKEEIVIGLIDGPVALQHPNLVQGNIRALPGKISASCSELTSSACIHGTFVAGMLAGTRGSSAPAICPGCTVLVAPIFATAKSEQQRSIMDDLAEAIVRTTDAGARLINMSLEVLSSEIGNIQTLTNALDYAARRGVITIAAAGNGGIIASTTLTRHPSVIPVVAFGLDGRPMSSSNLGKTIGQQGLGSPGTGVTSLSPDFVPRALTGTSVAVPFVTGAAALIWSEFPLAAAHEIKHAILRSTNQGRHSIVPPLLSAWTAYEAIRKSSLGRAKGSNEKLTF